MHSLTKKFEESYTEALLLLEAENIFKSLNRELAMKNCQLQCPHLYHPIYNSYSKASALFVNQKKLLSREDKTQGDPLAMTEYGIKILPVNERKGMNKAAVVRISSRKVEGSAQHTRQRQKTWKKRRI